MERLKSMVRLPNMTFHAVFTAQYSLFHFFWFGGSAQLWMVGCARWRMLWDTVEHNHSLGKREQPSLQLGRRQGWVWSQRWGRQERGVLLTPPQPSCLSQSCNWALPQNCMSLLHHTWVWDIININKAHYVKLAIDRSFFKRWNHNSHDWSVCVAGKLGAVLGCSSIFAFHYRSFLPTCGKGVLKERNEDDYK